MENGIEERKKEIGSAFKILKKIFPTIIFYVYKAKLVISTLIRSEVVK